MYLKNIRYIQNLTPIRIRIANMFVSSNLTEYKYWIWPLPHTINSKQGTWEYVQPVDQDMLMKDFTKNEYRMYSYSDCGPNTNIKYIHCSQPDWIWISNISNILFKANWPNTNIEYIRIKKIGYSYSVPNIGIFEYSNNFVFHCSKYFLWK